MFVSIHSAAVLGLDCTRIDVEVDITGAWPGFQIVGLPDTAIQEAKERIRTAWQNSHLTFPNNCRVVINLAPAHVRKVGSHYDLPMALGMYLAAEQSDISVSDSLFVGELALDGSLRHIRSALAITLFAKRTGYKYLYVPKENEKEVAAISGIRIFGVSSFQEILAHIHKEKEIKPTKHTAISPNKDISHPLDMEEIKGQTFAKRALEIAASGGHNILMSGPPGSGKTLLAKTIPSILPSMDMQEAIEVTNIYSAAGLLPKHEPLMRIRPFRTPHHSTSATALVGGGRIPRPGDVSLSHRGVLFLDEFAEFPRHVLEHLRQPLEDGIVTISRTQGTVSFPATFILVASQNPCPCGYATDDETPCTCTTSQIALYKKKISGPLLDRIDLHIEVPRVDFQTLTQTSAQESSADIRKRVEHARAQQQKRFADSNTITNAHMTNAQVKAHCSLDAQSQTLLQSAMKTFALTARSYYRTIKVARTIADMAGAEKIKTAHLAEALQYRQKTS